MLIPAFPGQPPSPDAQPVHVVVDGGAFEITAVGLSEAFPTILPALIDQMDRGMTHDVLALYAIVGVTHEGEFSFGLQNGVICSEWVPYESPDNIVKQGRIQFPTFPDSVLAATAAISIHDGDLRRLESPEGS